MPDLDSLIYKMAFAALLIALIKRDFVVPAFLLCFSFLFNELIFIQKPTWYQLEQYFFAHAAKDFLIAVALFLMYRLNTLVLALTFIASCLFHKFAQIEIANKVLDLKHIRSDFMTYITVAQIATIYASLLQAKGGKNGGKRARCYILTRCRAISDFLHSKAREVML